MRSGEGGEVVDEFVANNVAAVGYPTVGDVRDRTPAQVLEELMQAKNRTDFETLTQRLLDFAERMRDGEYIVTSDGARHQLVIGRVNGPYEWRESSPIPACGTCDPSSGSVALTGTISTTTPSRHS